MTHDVAYAARTTSAMGVTDRTGTTASVSRTVRVTMGIRPASEPCVRMTRVMSRVGLSARAT